MIPSRICNRKTSIVLEDYRRLNSFLEELDEPVVRVIICTFEKRIQLKANDWSTKWGKSPIPEISNVGYKKFRCIYWLINEKTRINCVILFNILSRILRKITISKQRYKYGNDSVVLFLEVKQMILQEARFHNEISD